MERLHHESNNDQSLLSYLADESMMLFQAGDMMSSFTPGFEGAALSGCDVAERVAQLIFGSNI
jgi:predicted NAD/FAD-dependent oxidoreductase